MTVYVEYVLIDNFVIDYILINATFKILKKTPSRLRLFLCALLGAAEALLYPLFESIPVLSVLIKILCGLLIVLLVDKHLTFKSFYIFAVIFFALTFALGGAITGIYGLLGIDYTDEISIGLMALPAIVLIKILTAVIGFILKRKHYSASSCECVLSLGNIEVKTDGFFDTGNALYLDNEPVIICGRKLALKLLGGMKIDTRLSYVAVTSVTGKSSLPCFKIDCLKIYNGDKLNIFKNVTVGASANVNGLILHPDLQKEDKNLQC